MPKGTVEESSVYCTSFLDFQESFGGKNVRAIEISAHSTIRTCDNPVIANQIAKAFSTCKSLYSNGKRLTSYGYVQYWVCSEIIIQCQGYDWVIGGSCGAELTVASMTEGRSCVCSESNHVTIRPCNGWKNWGGTGTGCKQDTTNLRVSAVIGNQSFKCNCATAP